MYTVRRFRECLKEALDTADKGECVHITRGKRQYEVKLCTQENKHYGKSVVKMIQEVKESLDKGITFYGCGCERIEKKVLCPKHGRV